jgi:hypothetical protein
MGKNSSALKSWYLRIFLPILVMVYLFEDIVNEESPRKFFWKHKFSIPALDDFLLHEVV